MARNGVKTGGRNWVKGQSGNPSGGPTLPREIRDARALTKLEFERLANQYLYLTPEETAARLADPSTKNIDRVVTAIIGAAIEHGDEKRLNFLLDRLIGKVADKVDGTMTIRNEAEISKLAAMSDRELLEYVRDTAINLLPNNT